MQPFWKKALLILLAFLPCIPCQLTRAETGQALASQQQSDELRKLQDYLNGIRTLRANFFQENPNGTTSSGKMYLKRLGEESFGKLLLAYDPPAKIRIIANGKSLRHEDGEAGDISEYSIDSTPASFLLRHKIDFFNDLNVKGIKRGGGKIYLTVMRPGDEGVTLTLVFVTAPMLRLQEWTVIDAQANHTHVVLGQVEIGIPLEDRLFAF